MKNEGYKELIEDIKDLSKTTTIIEGVVDVFFNAESNSYHIKDAKNSYWNIIGNASECDIDGCLTDELGFEIDEKELEGEGEYHFDAVLKYDKDDYMYGFWYIDYIEFHFQQTFLEREREEKLLKLLDDDDIFS